MFKRIVCLSLFLLPAVPAHSEVSTLPGVVVTASPWAEPEETVTQDLRVITREEIEAKGAAFVTDLLRGQPGLHVAQSGGTGKNASIFLRGGNSAHVLVLIDGVKINSPSTGSVDISGIAAGDIERIEIIKGPQSTLYGSEAMAGVINIITRQGTDQQDKVTLTTEAGSYRTVKNTATFAGAGDLWNYRLTADRFDSDGISVAKSGSERDGYQKSAVSSRIRLTPTEQAEVGLNLRYSRDRSELDSFLMDDPNYLQKRDNYLVSVDGKINPTEHYEQSLTLSLAGERSRYKDPDSEIDTDTRIADWRHTFDFAPATVTVGFNFRREAADIENFSSYDESTDNRAACLNGKLRFFDDSLILDGGIRHDSHETFGDHTTYRAGALYWLKPWGTRFKGNYGTGFRAPSLNELYWPFYGNENLEPEKSRSFDAGIEQEFFAGRLVLGAGWFRQRYRNLIDSKEIAPFTFIADNIGRARSEGWELEATLTPTDNLTLNAAFTTMDPVDLENDVRLDRRPKKTANASAEYRIAAFLLGVDYRYVGDRFDKWAPDPRLPSYSLVDLRLSYDLNPTVTLFARVNNLLDKDYEEVSGYETPDAAVYAGLRATF
ncbi:MAG: TonB-dependent receptor [Trichloromonas sp.]|jgi:vitamin B12 transporter|nr:TonB-dependent receptor [Trichloromonas sp.]